ncbi:MAG TPA: hypothetical protein DCS93_26185 [Microscillaceae bacterium]|nr:hypothetical protein [Microscillaceae bacterium]
MNYEICPITLTTDAISRYATFLGKVFHKPVLFTKAYLDWQYRQNPDGDTLGFDAFTPEGQLAAHYVVQPLQALVQGKLTKGLLSYNTATHPQHTGKGLFTRLAQATYKRAQALGYEFIVGVSNQQSTPGFIKKLGFQWVAPLTVKVGMGKITFPENAEYEYQRYWTPEALTWRFNHPQKHYSLKKQSQGFDIFTCPKPGIAVTLAHFPEDVLPFTHAKPQFYGAKMWMGIDAQIDWRKGLFINLPNRFKPSPLNLIFKDLTQVGRILDRTKIRFNALDFDAF